MQKQRNVKGLDTLKRCTITQNCIGELVQTDLLENHVKPNPTPHVGGIIDQTPRLVMHEHKQTIGKKVWKIQHNLGNIPVVFTFDTTMNPLEPIVSHIDENNLELSFPDKSYAGLAQCVVSSSKPDIVTTKQSEVISGTISKQLTFGQHISIAVLDQTYPSSFDLSIDFTDADGVITIQEYNVSMVNDDSTWGDFSYLYVKGKKYNVRSFDITGIDHNTAIFYHRTGPTRISFAPNDFFILLSSKNRSSYDKVLNQLIDVSSVSTIQNQFSFFVENGELYGETSIIQDVYPYIRKI